MADQNCKLPKPIKLKSCRECGRHFTPFSTTQVVCSQLCSVLYVKAKTAQKEKQQRTISRRELNNNDIKLQKAKAQAVFNRFIRLRDRDFPCISCGRFHTGQYHAGHYRTVGANPELRFNESNCHKQCSPCNNHLSGNIVNYRVGLIDRIGLAQVEELEGPHTAKKYTLDELKELQAKYKNLIKELDNAKND